MPEVLTLKDGRNVTVFDMDGILDEVDACMGYEVRRYIEAWKADVDEEQAANQYDWEESEKKMERLMDHHHSILCDLKQEAEALEELLDAPRLNRAKLQAAVRNINKMLWREM